ncbi:MAG TPA: MogA/MoaB family molybdenum cofactor biosynthesis protein [Longimicrobiales bacterium]
MAPIRVAVVTISDGVVQGARQDRSGPRIVEWVRQREHQLVTHLQIADDAAEITARLVQLADDDCDVVLTTGGTGLTMRDVTPEATRAALTRDVPGIAEALRARGAAQTEYSWLSRGVAGTRGRTLIVNLPGSESGVRDGLELLDGVIGHAVQLLRGIQTDKH